MYVCRGYISSAFSVSAIDTLKVKTISSASTEVYATDRRYRFTKSTENSNELETNNDKKYNLLCGLLIDWYMLINTRI